MYTDFSHVMLRLFTLVQLLAGIASVRNLPISRQVCVRVIEQVSPGSVTMCITLHFLGLHEVQNIVHFTIVSECLYIITECVSVCIYSQCVCLSVYYPRVCVCLYIFPECVSVCTLSQSVCLSVYIARVCVSVCI